jgi:hypothetical protein
VSRDFKQVTKVPNAGLAIVRQALRCLVPRSRGQSLAPWPLHWWRGQFELSAYSRGGLLFLIKLPVISRHAGCRRAFAGGVGQSTAYRAPHDWPAGDRAIKLPLVGQLLHGETSPSVTEFNPGRCSCGNRD